MGSLRSDVEAEAVQLSKWCWREQCVQSLAGIGRLALALVVLLSVSQREVLAEPLSAALLDDLKKGGYIIYFRHAETEHPPGHMEREAREKNQVDLADCSSQRNLSEQGRAKAAVAGRALRSLGIPVGVAVASRYCRTMETARLIYGEPIPSDDLTRLEEGKDGRAGALLDLLSVPPAQGTNTLIFAHRGILSMATGESAEEGEAVIFRPAGAGQSYRVVWRVKIHEWAESPGAHR